MTDVLNLPRPAWMSEDVVLLEETARRFISAEYGPHLEKWREDHFYPREVWTKAGAAGLLCASMPEEYGGAGGTFAHEAVIDRQCSLAGFDAFGAPLHSGIVAPYILHYGTEEGQGFYQLMKELPQERLIVSVNAVAMMERALALTIDYVKQRDAFGKKVIDFQNTQFVLAECKSEATIARVFLDHCIERHVKGELDTVTASMAKYWHTDLVGKIVDRCLQLFGGYGYMDEYPISRMYRDARVMRIYAGTNEIMKLLIARSL